MNICPKCERKDTCIETKMIQIELFKTLLLISHITNPEFLMELSVKKNPKKQRNEHQNLELKLTQAFCFEWQTEYAVTHTPESFTLTSSSREQGAELISAAKIWAVLLKCRILSFPLWLPTLPNPPLVWNEYVPVQRGMSTQLKILQPKKPSTPLKMTHRSSHLTIISLV